MLPVVPEHFIQLLGPERCVGQLFENFLFSLD